MRIRSAKPARRGATLIEVLAGLVVLATLLTAVGIARGRFLRQWAEADEKMRGARAVDALVATWVTEDSINVPLNSTGNLEGVPGGFWRTHLVAGAGANKLGALVVRLEVVRRTSNTPLFSVDLLAPQLRPKLQGAR